MSPRLRLLPQALIGLLPKPIYLSPGRPHLSLLRVSLLARRPRPDCPLPRSPLRPHAHLHPSPPRSKLRWFLPFYTKEEKRLLLDSCLSPRLMTTPFLSSNNA